MASISITDAWIGPVSALSTQIQIGAASITGGNSKSGAIMHYAGGRTRLVTRPGTVESVQVSTIPTSKTIRDALDDLVGELILIRDHRGRKVYGAMFNVRADEVKGSSHLCKLSFAVSSVTHSEEV